MQDNIFKTPKGELYYTIKDNSVTVTSYSGDDEVLEIPETIEDAKVRAIDKKAFMNTRSLRKSLHIFTEWRKCILVRILLRTGFLNMHLTT